MSSSWTHSVPEGGVVWMKAEGDAIEVSADAPAAPMTDPLEAIRNQAWMAVGVPYNPTAAFARYARAHSLGVPLTTEFDITIGTGKWRAQGFALAILWAPLGPNGEWIVGDNVEVMDW